MKKNITSSYHQMSDYTLISKFVIPEKRRNLRILYLVNPRRKTSKDNLPAILQESEKETYHNESHFKPTWKGNDTIILFSSWLESNASRWENTVFKKVRKCPSSY
jgi:hypothetical protein